MLAYKVVFFSAANSNANHQLKATNVCETRSLSHRSKVVRWERPVAVTAPSQTREPLGLRLSKFSEILQEIALISNVILVCPLPDGSLVCEGAVTATTFSLRSA